ncbi:hypothetical protein [Methanobrevibacter sp.]|uniref:hypothetical protein n=1 Tax=Methanobrevibacter sp. TaxID=66852 RepID=UPI00388EA5FF
MDKKIIATLIVLLFCVGCLGIASAENITNETAKSNESPDMSGHIQPISITDKGIEFSDGFAGFCLDSTKDPITTADGFARQKTGNDEIQNYVKLAIIEAYKQGCENNLAQIIASFADGSYKNSNDKVITAVLKSQDTIGDNATVELEDSVEGTFEFELLKDMNGKKSDCLAYKVSLKEVQNNDKLAATANNNATDDNNGTDDNGNTTNSTDNKTNDKQDDEKTENKTDDNKQDTIVNETNKTIVNKTNTVIVNEKNTTIINQNNTKVINKTNDTPQNATIPNKLLRTVGNPIFLLIVVIVIAAVVAVVMRRKGQ